VLDLHPWQWALAGACALLVGTAKTGVPGLGILVVPLMVYVISDPLFAPGALLPLLIAADVFGVFYYRRHASAWALWHLIPWVAIGLIAGRMVMVRLTDRDAFAFLIGAIVLAMVAVHLARKRIPDQAIAADWRRGAVFGMIAGFATTTANAAGPVMNVYLLSMALPKDQFMGTGAWFFLIVNCAKVPVYLSLPTPIITGATLAFDACLLPGIVLGALCGRRIYERIPQKSFEWVVLTLTAVGGIMLLLPKLRELAASPS
jgi:uncharacterized membrane protein YfcA